MSEPKVFIITKDGKRYSIRGTAEEDPIGNRLLITDNQGNPSGKVSLDDIKSWYGGSLEDE